MKFAAKITMAIFRARFFLLIKLLAIIISAIPVNTDVAKAVELTKSGAYCFKRWAEALNGRIEFARISRSPKRYASRPIINGAII